LTRGPILVLIGAMPTEINSGQRAFLRSVGRNCKPDVNIGKSGITPAALAHVQSILQRRELVKLQLLESATKDRKQAAQELAKSLDAVLVDVVGRSVVLYRPNPKLPEHERLPLPK
jgi:RNA-binding protein